MVNGYHIEQCKYRTFPSSQNLLLGTTELEQGSMIFWARINVSEDQKMPLGDVKSGQRKKGKGKNQELGGRSKQAGEKQ